MALTKKHFERVARIIKQRNDMAEALMPGEVQIRRDAHWNIAGELASFFREENPKFDTSRFLAACGWEGR